MPNCSNCAAPLPPHTAVCTYCKTRNNIDLTGIGDYSVDHPESERICPRCDIGMKTLQIKTEKPVYIEQCDQCYGFFFDPGELEYLLTQQVTHVFDINHKRLGNVTRDINQEHGVKYIKCPVCEKFMNRLNFGAKSGVVIDRCKEHGVWLDGGELKQIMEWKKAGGAMFHEQKQQEMKKIEEFKERQLQREQMRESAQMNQSGGFGGAGMGGGGFGGAGGKFGSGGFHHEEDLISMVVRFIGKFFRGI